MLHQSYMVSASAFGKTCWRPLARKTWVWSKSSQKDLIWLDLVMLPVFGLRNLHLPPWRSINFKALLPKKENCIRTCTPVLVMSMFRSLFGNRRWKRWRMEPLSVPSTWRMLMPHSPWAGGLDCSKDRRFAVLMISPAREWTLLHRSLKSEGLIRWMQLQRCACHSWLDLHQMSNGNLGSLIWNEHTDSVLSTHLLRVSLTLLFLVPRLMKLLLAPEA